MLAFKAILVEGTSGVGKSTLIDSLIRRHVNGSKPRKIRSLVHLAQSHTYGPLAVPEDRGTLTVEENFRHLERIVGAIQWLHSSVQEHDHPWCFVVIDTLHLTQCVRPGVVCWEDVSSFDGRLAALGCKLLLLEASPSSLWERGIEPRKNDQFIQQYAKKFGSTHQKIHEYFVDEQEKISALFSKSAMKKLRVNTDAEPESVLKAAYQFWTDL